MADVDGDDLLDLYVTRLDGADILYRNRGDGTFEDVTAAAGLAAFNLQSNGASFGDIDNDGDPDLYVTVIGQAADRTNNRNYLFVNDGAGRFSEEAVERGASVSSERAHRGFSVAMGDYDRDGWLDMHTTEWIAEGPSHSRLLRNRGRSAPGYYTDATVTAGVSLDGSFAFASTFADLNQDGWPDLAVVGDFGTSRLFWNRRDGTFVDGTAAARVGTEEDGMGSTIGDFDGDGLLDWFVTSIHDDADDYCRECSWHFSGNRLFRNLGDSSFSDATDFAGVRDGGWGWGAAFLDADNDADLDLVMTNGIDFGDQDFALRFLSDPLRLWLNDGLGRMTESAARAGLTDHRSGKGLIVFDFDGDAALDLFIVNNGDAPTLYRNESGGPNGWLRVTTIGTASNREGIGARVIVHSDSGRCQTRDVASASHLLGQSERVAHFGLGPGLQPVDRVVVWWPSGAVGDYRTVPRNTTLIAREPVAPGAGRGIVADTLPPTFASLDECWRHRPEPAPTAGMDGGCPGDCTGDGTVTVDELTRGVGILIGAVPLGMCPSFDANANGTGDLMDLVMGVRASLQGCGSSAADSTDCAADVAAAAEVGTATRRVDEGWEG